MIKSLVSYSIQVASMIVGGGAPSNDELLRLATFFQETGKIGFFSQDRFFDQRDPVARGETGATPKLRDNYQDLIHTSYERGIDGKALSSSIFGTAWSLHQDRFWDEVAGICVSRSPFHFSWKRMDEAESVEVTSIPLDFAQGSSDRQYHHRYHHSNKNNGIGEYVFDSIIDEDEWVLIRGRTSGTCFRSNQKSDPTNEWRKGTISNVYECSLNHNGKPYFHYFRHGAVGYLADLCDMAVDQFELILRRALEVQRNNGLPNRIVTIVAMHQAPITGEDKLVARFLRCSSQAASRVFSGDAGDMARILLPLNTDQFFMAAADCDPVLNIAGFAMYLRWVVTDTSIAMLRLMSGTDKTERGAHWCSLTEGDRAVAAVMMSNPDIDKGALIKTISSQGADEFVSDLLMTIARADDKSLWEVTAMALRDYAFKVAEVMDTEVALPTGRRSTVTRYSGSSQGGASISTSQQPSSAGNTKIHQVLVECLEILRLVSRIVAFIADKIPPFAVADPTPAVKDFERSAISLNLLRTFALAEMEPAALGRWRLCAAERKYTTGSARRAFNRSTSLCVFSLLNVTLGACVFGSCKSGLDRTGVWAATQTAMASLWKLYPKHRWALHLTAINWNLIKGRSSDGFPSFQQPLYPKPADQEFTRTKSATNREILSAMQRQFFEETLSDAGCNGAFGIKANQDSKKQQQAQKSPTKQQHDQKQQKQQQQQQQQHQQQEPTPVKRREPKVYVDNPKLFGDADHQIFSFSIAYQEYDDDEEEEEPLLCRRTYGDCVNIQKIILASPVSSHRMDLRDVLPTLIPPNSSAESCKGIVEKFIQALVKCEQIMTEIPLVQTFLKASFDEWQMVMREKLDAEDDATLHDVNAMVASVSLRSSGHDDAVVDISATNAEKEDDEPKPEANPTTNAANPEPTNNSTTEESHNPNIVSHGKYQLDLSKPRPVSEEGFTFVELSSNKGDAAASALVGLAAGHEEWLDSVLFDGKEDLLKALCPLSFLIRNFSLVFHCEVNARVAFASTGVRGMKYHKHPLIPHLVSSHVTLPDGSGAAVSRNKSVAIVDITLHSKAASYRLTTLGNSLLTDAGKKRSS